MSDKKYTWNLDALYEGIGTPEYKADLQNVKELIGRAQALSERLAGEPSEKDLVAAVHLGDEIQDKLMLVVQLPALLSAADTTNTGYQSLLNRLMVSFSALEGLTVNFQKALAKVDDIDRFAQENGLEHYTFMLKESKAKATHKMNSTLEELASRLNVSGGSAWSNLQSYLTSTLEVEYEGETVTLSHIRNLAHDPDREVRRKAYEAELASYKKIESPVAFALNSIKQQVKFLSGERGFESPLAEALHDSRMDQETLDAMLGVMEKSFPDFRRYFKAKARLLGTDELAFYDLFAPVGEVEEKYTVEEAGAYLQKVFQPLSEDIAGIMQQAFEEDWIDFLPRPGKAGGAFCSNIPQIKQSRILTNFDGSFDSISTLAHELGHAYHGHCIEDHAPQNQDYSMPVAETASTFNETHLTLQAVDTTEDVEKKLALLDGFLSGTAQTIVDIYSRYTFEKEVFDRCEEDFMDSEALQDIMLRAQEVSYGDGLAKDIRHPYMWVCKGHYYSSGLSYYNFPYAFGQLFSMGLYNMYRKQGPGFMDKYKEMLHETTVSSCEDAAKTVGVDLRKADFWEASMSEFVGMIDTYCELVDSKTAG